MADTVRNQAFYEEAGYNAFRLGVNSFNCPYKPGTKLCMWWMNGYAKAKREHAKPFDVSEKSKPVPVPNVVGSQQHFRTRTYGNVTRSVRVNTITEGLLRRVRAARKGQ